MKKLLTTFASAGVLALFAVLVPTTVLAASAKTGTNVNLAKSETNSGTLYASGQNVVIDGTVNGDLICAGQVVTINGPVSGDVLCVAQTLTINGPVAGNVRVAGQTVALNGTIGKNLNVAAQTLNFGSSASVGGEAGIWAETAVVSAPVGSNLYGSMTTLNLESTVGGNVDVIVKSLSLGNEAKIAGNLGYASSATFTIDQAKVGGTITRSDLPEGAAKPASPGFSFAGWLAGRLYVLVALLVIAVPLAWLAPRPLNRLVTSMLDRPGSSVGWGFVGQVALPVIGILVFLTFVGIPLALLGLVLWILLLSTSAIFAGIAVGRYTLKRAKWNQDSLLWATIAGIVIFVAITSLPILGVLISIVAIWWVTGGLMLSAKYLR